MKKILIFLLLTQWIFSNIWSTETLLSKEDILELLAPTQTDEPKNTVQKSSYDPSDVSNFQTTKEFIIKNILKEFQVEESRTSTNKLDENKENDDFLLYSYGNTDIESTMIPANDGLLQSPNAATEIKLFQIDFGQGPFFNKNLQVSFINDADKLEILEANQGHIFIERNLNNNDSVLSGILDAKGKMRTRIDIPLIKNENFSFNTFLLDKESFYDLLQNKEINEYGGFILVDMADESTYDVDIDAHYQQKIYLDNNMEILEEGDPFHFIFFLCVDPGNVTFTYRTDWGRSHKTAHIQPEEIFFEIPLIQKKQTKKFAIKEHMLLTGNSLPLELSGYKVRHFMSTEPSFVESLGSYAVDLPPTPITSRPYLTIEQHYYKFFVDALQADISVPDEKRFTTYLDYMDINHMDNICVNQVNFTKTPIDIFVESSSYGGSLMYETFYMTEDGDLYDAFEDFTKSLFVIGDRQGVSRIKVLYDDYSVDYLQTYCNNSIYVIENL